MKVVHVVLPLLMLAAQCFAVPASNDTFFLKQPDGSSIEVRYVGDENSHALVSADGYILQKDALGYYAYVNEKGQSSGIYARDAQDRSTTDMEFLAGLDPEAIYKKMIDNAPTEDVPDYGIPKFVSPKIQRLPTPKYNLTLGELRGIILLVQFSDVKFKSSNPQKLYTDFMNKEGFSEFAHNGSVRDYYIHNSMGKFTPTYDVYGPITVPGSRESYGKNQTGNKGAKKAIQEALDTLVKRGGIDFSMYDKDKDGFVDFVFMIFAGVGAANSGNKDAIWPHAGSIGNIGNPKKGVKLTDDIYMNRYACANEISGKAYKKDSTTSTIEGIGTVVHEFGHVLGLPDLYDTKKTNPRKPLGSWDIMASGNYNCPSNSYNTQCCSPPLFSAFERMSLGWFTPTELNDTGSVKLDKLDDNIAFSVTNPKNPNEMFLLEYRTKKNWDRGQKSSGMLIWHIDYSDSVWKKGGINSDSNHIYVNIIEAVPETSTSAATTDPFPGSGKVTDFNKFIFWNGDDMKIALSNITESPDTNYVTFTVDMTIKSSSSMSSSSSVSSSSAAVSSSSVLSSSAAYSSSSALSSSATSSSSSVLSSSATSSSSSIFSSSATLSSSSNTSSSSALSSSSETVLSSSIAPSSSSLTIFDSSSSTEISSSSSDYTVFVTHHTPAHNVKVRVNNGDIYIQAPQQGEKTVQIFSPLGTLLLEKTMDGNELIVDGIRELQNSNVILSVTQGQKRLFTGTLKAVTR